MNGSRYAFHLILLALPIGASGCAAQYHDDSCGYPSYGYCPSAPLPYVVYDGCPTPAAAHYGYKPISGAQPDFASEAADSSSP